MTTTPRSPPGGSSHQAGGWECRPGDSPEQEFREQIKDVHGVDLANDPPPKAELISDITF